jgi:formyl-CoA transferase
MALPLAGIRVLDLTNVLSGPFCTQQLAHLGADVVKIEAPGRGDLARHLGADPELARQGMGVTFLANNAGKRSVTLNLKHATGAALFRRMVARAHVVVENFRPGVMDRLGLGYPDLRAANPRLVYCALSGFGQTGPLADRAAYDQVVQGYSGIMSVTGDEASAPLRVGFPLCDTIGGMTAAFAIAAALCRQRATGEGAFIDVAMLDATLGQLGFVTANYLNGGEVPRPWGNDNPTACPSGTFRTAEGLLNIAANEQKHYERLCELIGRPELRTDPRFADREARRGRRAELNRLLEAALATRPAAEWEVILGAAGIPCGPVLSVPAALAHPQVQARGLVQALRDVPGVPGEVRVLRAGFRLDGETPGAPGPPPGLGEHTGACLAELALDADAVARLRADGVV